MQRHRITVELDSHDAKALQDLAAEERRTVEEIIELAVRNYVARRTLDDEKWKQGWAEAVASLRSGVPDDVTAEEIEAEVRAARSEFREQRRARHG